MLTPIDGRLLGILRQPSPAPKYGHGFAYILWETPSSAGLYKAIRASLSLQDSPHMDRASRTIGGFSLNHLRVVRCLLKSGMTLLILIKL